MHLRFFVVLIAMLLQVQVSTAQRWDDNDMGAFFGIDVTKANLNWVDMNKLVDSYNRVLAGHLKKELNHPAYPLAPAFSLGVGNANVQIFINYAPIKIKMDSELNNGERREMRMTNHLQSFQIDMGFPFEVPYKFGYTVGGSFNRGKLYSRYIYNDGTVSYTSEQPLNGVFTGGGGSVNVGLFAMYQTDKFDFQLRADYLSTFLIDDGVDMYDNQSETFNIYENETEVKYLPVNYDDRNKALVVQHGVGNNVDALMKGWKFSLCARYYFKIWD